MERQRIEWPLVSIAQVPSHRKLLTRKTQLTTATDIYLQIMLEIVDLYEAVSHTM